MGTILHRRAGADLPDKLEPCQGSRLPVHAVTNAAPEKVGFISLGQQVCDDNKNLLVAHLFWGFGLFYFIS